MLPFPVICGKLLTLLNQKGVGDGLKIEIATPFFVFMPTFFPSYIDFWEMDHKSQKDGMGRAINVFVS